VPHPPSGGGWPGSNRADQAQHLSRASLPPGTGPPRLWSARSGRILVFGRDAHPFPLYICPFGTRILARTPFCQGHSGGDTTASGPRAETPGTSAPHLLRASSPPGAGPSRLSPARSLPPLGHSRPGISVAPFWAGIPSSGGENCVCRPKPRPAPPPRRDATQRRT
jgi:hypothetical protein